LIKFSIITVVKNNVHEIEKTIKSMHLQDFRNFEHIIIDGNSTDGTSKIIRKKKNSKIKYYRSSDGGIYDAINKGIHHSRGEYVGLLHSGDFYSSNKILLTVNRVLKKNDILVGNVSFYNKKINIFRNWKKPFSVLTPHNSFTIPHTGMFIKKKIFREIGNYNAKYKISADTDFIIRLSKYKYKLIYLNQYILHMKSGGVSFSIKNIFRKIYEDMEIYLNHFNIYFIFMYFAKIFSKVFDFPVLISAPLREKIDKKLKYQYKRIVN
jgi:glycosyltransferase involved in cell wall biosynthesis